MFEICFQLRETFDSWYANENHIRNDDDSLYKTHICYFIYELQFNLDFPHIYPDSAFLCHFDWWWCVDWAVVSRLFFHSFLLLELDINAAPVNTSPHSSNFPQSRWQPSHRALNCRVNWMFLTSAIMFESLFSAQDRYDFLILLAHGNSDKALRSFQETIRLANVNEKKRKRENRNWGECPQKSQGFYEKK